MIRIHADADTKSRRISLSYEITPEDLSGRPLAKPDSGAIAEELYLSILTRPPTDPERKEVADCLADRAADRAGALQDLAWALIASAEFRFNY